VFILSSGSCFARFFLSPPACGIIRGVTGKRRTITGGASGSTVNIYGRVIPKGTSKKTSKPVENAPSIIEVDDEKDTVTAIGWCLRYQTGRSDKQYRVMQLGSVVIFSWGRFGAVGQSSVHRCADGDAARRLALNKTDEKIHKGYRVETPPSLLRVRALSWISMTRTGRPTREGIHHAWDGEPERLGALSFHQAAQRAQNLEEGLSETYRIIKALFPEE